MPEKINPSSLSGDVFYLPQKPYNVVGTLVDQLTYPASEKVPEDEWFNDHYMPELGDPPDLAPSSYEPSDEPPRPEEEIADRFKLDSPELHNLGDPLNKDLKDRIKELEEEDDGEGDVVVRR